MQPQYPGYQRQVANSGQQMPAPYQEGDAPPPTDGMECPECGLLLVDMDHRRKHAVYHYGENRIPWYHNHTQAAERKAALLGVPVEQVRG